ncbi:helix-loop-helix protein delilah-like [Bacillus rossius redtenbacheri]|uniref:helix-loop-helix protein delilah-like n=1 Tax=Bacillus rossius redtenbacheri TaxID=93214 RepID=UPI002FDEF076
MDFNLTFQMPPLLSLQAQFSTGAAGGTDPNNNNDDGFGADEEGARAGRKGEKYSLRPRSLQKRFEVEQKTRVVEKSTTRRSISGGGGGGRPKQKPPPLSKYRRKTANARERDRMREINAAFESLRRAVPHSPADACPQGEKLTKIATLRLAMRYISALSQALQQEEEHDPASAPRYLDLEDLLSDGGGGGGDFGEEDDDDSLCLRSDLSDASSFTPPDFGRSTLSTPVFGDPAHLDGLFS